ncbi:MAG: FtsX-like permease family protein, partial [Gammaproteobacteria bacterium]
PEYFDLMQIKLLAGRLFDSRDNAESQPVVIIDQDFVDKQWPGESAIGKQVRIGVAPNPVSGWLTVVGVVSNTHHDQVDNPELPTMFQPISQRPARFMTVMARTDGPPMSYGNTMREVVQSVDPNLPIYWLRTVEDWIAIGMFTANILSTLFAIFALVGVLLAAAGIYGVLAYSVSQRTREIGVRRALGALDGRILGMVLRQSVWQLGIGMSVGLVLGLLVSYALSRVWVLADIFDPVMFVTVAVFLTLTAIVATLFPVIRAIRVDPMEALRYE